MGAPRAFEPSSGRLALLCHAAPPISVPFRNARATAGDAPDLLGRRFGFVDALLRYVLAVLATELAGLELPPPKALEELLGRLEGAGATRGATLGTWLEAAFHSARALARQAPSSMVIPEAAFFLVTTKTKPTPATQALKALIKTRNGCVHEDGRVFVGPPKARALLEEIDPLLKTVVEEVAPFARLPLLLVDSNDEDQDGVRSARVIRYVGVDLQTVEVDGHGLRLPRRVPFMVSEKGDVLLLSPLVAVDEWGTVASPRAPSRWNGQRLLYADPHGGDPKETYVASDYEAPTRWLARPVLHARRRGAVPATVARRFRDVSDLTGISWAGHAVGGRGEAYPEIPGVSILGVLGRGASTDVYLTQVDGRRRAIKLLKPHVAQSSLQRQRFRAEWEVMQRLQQKEPAIARVYRWCEDAPCGPYIEMEHIDGVDLEAEVQSGGPLEPTRAVVLIKEALRALATAHRQDVLHRDLKPSNLMVEHGSGAVRLIDFGIALTEWRTRHTDTGGMGTHGFAAPEQLRGEEVTCSSDLYSICRTLEYLVQGPVSGARPPLPPGLRAVLRKGTHPKPRRRYQRAEDLLADLEEREGAGWVGAPVQVGDQLNETYELTALEGTVDDDLWVYRARDVVGDEVGIVLAPEQGLTEKLTKALLALSSPERQQIGYRGTLDTHEGIRFVVLTSESVMRSAHQLLGLEPPREPPPVPKPPSRPPPPPIAAMSPFLVELELELPAGDVGATTAAAARVALVALAQMEALCDRDIDAADWFAWTRRPLWQLENTLQQRNLRARLTQRGLGPHAEAALEAAASLQRARSRLSHAKRTLMMGSTTSKRSADTAALALLRLVRELSARIPATRLWPCVASVGGAWGLLLPRGYRVFGEERQVAERSAGVTRWIAHSSLDTHHLDSDAARLREQRYAEIRATVQRELARWAASSLGTSSVGRPESPGELSPELTVDFGERPVLAVDIRLVASRQRLAREMDGLAKLALAAPFVLHTDAERWFWFRGDGSGGIEEIDGWEDLVDQLKGCAPQELSRRRRERLRARLRRTRAQIEAQLRSDAGAALGASFEAIDAVCRAIAEEVLGHRPIALQLAQVVAELRDRKALPDDVARALEPVERHASLYRSSDSISADAVRPIVGALHSLLDWYLIDDSQGGPPKRSESSVLFNLGRLEDLADEGANEALNTRISSAGSVESVSGQEGDEATALISLTGLGLVDDDADPASDAHGRLSEALVTGNARAAFRAIREILAEDKHDLDALVAFARLRPESLRVRVYVAERLVAAGHIDAGVVELEEVARKLLEAGDEERFIRVAERLLWLAPLTYETALQLASVYQSREELSRTLRVLNTVRRGHPRDRAVLERMAEVYSSLGDRREVERVWRVILDLSREEGDDEGADAARRQLRTRPQV